MSICVNNIAGFRVDETSYVCILSACAATKSLQFGKQLFQEWQNSHFQNSLNIRNTLIAMFTKCGEPGIAMSYLYYFTFTNPLYLTLFILWNVKQQSNIITYTNILTACAAARTNEALQIGEIIHKELRNNKINTDPQLDFALLTMYSNCGIPQKALNLWKKFLARSSTPPTTTFASVLHACAVMGPVALEYGKDIHNMITSRGVQIDPILCEALLEMYIKCGEKQCVVDMWNTTTTIQTAKICTVFLSACAEVGATALTLRQTIHRYIMEKGTSYIFFFFHFFGLCE